jgi:hypothetical protein
MQFVKDCARRIDDGESYGSVIKDVRERYSTLKSIDVKLSQIRSLCTPTEEYTSKLAEMLRVVNEERGKEFADMVEECASKNGRGGTAEVRKLVRTLPPKISKNARRMCITREERKQCRRLSKERATEKNKNVLKIEVIPLLEEMRRCFLSLNSLSKKDIPNLALCLMFATGRRSCEILNGRSSFSPLEDWKVEFGGQAKKIGDSPIFPIPLLAPSEIVVVAVEKLRQLQGNEALTNLKTSRRYQSLLSKRVSDQSSVWNPLDKPHSLRGIYAKLCFSFFEWDDSEAYVTMNILGHSNIEESLVYTPFKITDDPSLLSSFLENFFVILKK